MSFKSFKKKVSGILPSYSYIPLAACVVINIIAFYATRLITGGFTHYDLSLPIDGKIPFVPPFIVIYVLAFVQWLLGFILIARDSRSLCYGVISGEIIAKLISTVIFIALPTAMVRPTVAPRDIFSRLTGFIYTLDTPDNLFPSLHCLESWICFRASMKMKKTGKLYMYSSLVFTLLVFASTVLIKQHLVADIVGGVAVAELGLFISEKSGAASVFEKAENLKNIKKGSRSEMRPKKKIQSRRHSDEEK